MHRVTALSTSQHRLADLATPPPGAKGKWAPATGALPHHPGRHVRLRQPPLGLDEHDVGEAFQSLEFSVEHDAADAIVAADASAPNKAEHEFGTADESKGLSDHRVISTFAAVA